MMPDLLLEKIKKYQQKECDGLLPADNKFKAEKYIINLIIANLSPWHVFASA